MKHIVTVSVALTAPCDDREGMVGEIIWNLRLLQDDVFDGFVHGTYDDHAIIHFTGSTEAEDYATAEMIVNDKVRLAVRNSGFSGEHGWFVRDPAHDAVMAA